MNANSYPNYDAWFDGHDGTLPVPWRNYAVADFTGLAEVALPFRYREKITNLESHTFSSECELVCSPRRVITELVTTSNEVGAAGS